MFLGPLKTFFSRKGTEFNILSDFTRCVRPGEVSPHLVVRFIRDASCVRGSREWMYQLFARNGKSTKRVEGNVEYGGINARTFFRGEAAYNAEGPAASY